MVENPGAYQEARNRLREQKEKEQSLKENIIEKFEKEKALHRTQKKFDIFELRHRIETGNSLNTLQSDIQEALRRGLISRETFDSLEKKIDVIIQHPEKLREMKKTSENNSVSDQDVPLGNTELAKFFENKKIGENFLIDIAGFSYGFVVQGGAIFIILIYKILHDILFLPRDIYKELKK